MATFSWRPYMQCEPTGFALLRREGRRRRVLIRATSGPDCVPDLRSADVLRSMACAQLALQCPPPQASSSKVRCRSSTVAAAESHVAESNTPGNRRNP